MTKIIIRPHLTEDQSKEPILKPHDFKIYIERRSPDGSIINTKHFNLDHNYICEHRLNNDDLNALVGVTYLGTTQKITDHEEGTFQGEPTYTVTQDTLNKDDLILFAKGFFGDGTTLTENIIRNEVGVNVRSVDIKQPFEVRLTPTTGAPTRDQV